MYRAVVSLLLLTLLVGAVIAISPRARAEATHLWEETKPTVVAWKDKTLEIFGFTNGEPDADIHIAPEPGSPGLDFEVIITFRGAGSL